MAETAFSPYLQQAESSMSGFVVRCFSHRTLPQLSAALSERGVKSYSLDGSSIVDEASFLETFLRNVPFKIYAPSDRGPRLNWDAFTDCLWGGLKSEPEGQVAILWLASEQMLDGKLSLLLHVVEAISAEAFNLLTPHSLQPDQEHRILLRVYLIGDGSNFPDFCTGDDPF